MLIDNMTKRMGVQKFWSFQVCTCRRSMHPWDTLILLASIAVCSCDSSNFSFDVECVLTSASAHPCTTYVNFSTQDLFLLSYLYQYKLNQNKLLVNHIWTSIRNEVSSGEKMQSKVWWEVGTWYFTLKMEKYSCYVLPNNVSSSLPVEKKIATRKISIKKYEVDIKDIKSSNYRRVFLSIFICPWIRKYKREENKPSVFPKEPYHITYTVTLYSQSILTNNSQLNI